MHCAARRHSLRILAFSAKGLVDVPLEYSPTFPPDAPNWREHSLSLLDRAHDLIAETYPEVSVTTAIGSGHGWSGAVDSLKWKKGDLLCLGSAPMGPIERVFIGSTATELLPTWAFQYWSVPVPTIKKHVRLTNHGSRAPRKRSHVRRGLYEPASPRAPQL